MSIEAITWALSTEIKHTTAKFVLVVLANCANPETNLAYPSIQYLSDATGQDRKTVLANIKKLIELGYIEDTGERTGRTKQIPVYHVNSTKNGTIKKGKNDAENGTVKQSQNRNSTKNGTVPFFPLNSPKNGTRKPKETNNINIISSVLNTVGDDDLKNPETPKPREVVFTDSVSVFATSQEKSVLRAGPPSQSFPSADDHYRAGKIAMWLLNQKIDTSATRSEILDWARRPEVTKFVLEQAIAKARITKGDEKITSKYLEKIVEQVLKPEPSRPEKSAPQIKSPHGKTSWSMKSLEDRGEKLGVFKRDGETIASYENRVYEAEKPQRLREINAIPQARASP